MGVSEAYSDLCGTAAPSTAPDPRTAELIDRLSAAANRNFAPATALALQKLLDGYDYAVAAAMVDDVTKLDRIPQNVVRALKSAYWARMGARGTSKGELPKEEWVDAYEGSDECDQCRAPVYVVRENVGHYYSNAAELNYIRARHRLRYTCGECGHSASWTVAAKDMPPGHPRRWDAGEPGDFAAFAALSEEVSRWHALGLVETRTNLKGQTLLETAMSAEVWIQAGRPPSWSPIWDEIYPDYPAACHENRLKAYCDGWRERLERGRESRTARRAAS